MGIVVLIIVVFAAGIIMGLMIGFGRTMYRIANRVGGIKRSTGAWVFMSIGALLCITAMGFAIYTSRFVQLAQHAKGVVIELRKGSATDDGQSTYAPTFRFTDAANVSHTIFASGFSSPPAFKVNEEVDVLYAPGDPEGARINSFTQLWLLPFVLFMLGIVFLPAGFLVLLWPKITARFQPTTLPQSVA